MEILLKEIEALNNCICESTDLFKNYTVKEAQEMLKRTCVILNVDFNQKKEEIQKLLKSAGKVDKILKDSDKIFAVLNQEQSLQEFSNQLNMKLFGNKYLICQPLTQRLSMFPYKFLSTDFNTNSSQVFQTEKLIEQILLQEPSLEFYKEIYQGNKLIGVLICLKENKGLRKKLKINFEDKNFEFHFSDLSLYNYQQKNAKQEALDNLMTPNDLRKFLQEDQKQIEGIVQMREKDGQTQLNQVQRQQMKVNNSTMKKIQKRAKKLQPENGTTLADQIQAQKLKEQSRIKKEILDPENLLKKRRESIKQKSEGNKKKFNYKKS